MTRRTSVALIGVLAVMLAACSGSPVNDRTATPPPSAAVADDATPGTPAPTPTPTPTQEAEAPPLPDGPLATGQVADNGHLSVVIPDGFSEKRAYDGGRQFDGPLLPEAAEPGREGDQGMYSTVGLSGVGIGWSQGFFAAGDANVTQTVYSLDIPGAQSATFEFLSLEEGFHTELVNNGGTSWTGRHGTAEIWVVANGEVSGVWMVTHPGQAGLDFATAVARTIRVAGAPG